MFLYKLAKILNLSSENLFQLFANFIYCLLLFGIYLFLELSFFWFDERIKFFEIVFNALCSQFILLFMYSYFEHIVLMELSLFTFLADRKIDTPRAFISNTYNRSYSTGFAFKALVNKDLISLFHLLTFILISCRWDQIVKTLTYNSVDGLSHQLAKQFEFLWIIDFSFLFLFLLFDLFALFFWALFDFFLLFLLFWLLGLLFRFFLILYLLRRWLLKLTVIKIDFFC